MNEAENWQIEDKDNGHVSQTAWTFVIIEDNIGIGFFSDSGYIKALVSFLYSFQKQTMCVTKC